MLCVFVAFGVFVDVLCLFFCVVLLLRLGFEVHVRERAFVFVVLLLPCVFFVVLKSIFGSELLFLLSCCALVFFSVALPMFLHFCWGFHSQERWAKIIFFLGLVFESHFRERAFVFVVLLPPCVFRCRFAYVFAYLLGFFIPENAWQKFSSS